MILRAVTSQLTHTRFLLGQWGYLPMCVSSFSEFMASFVRHVSDTAEAYGALPGYAPSARAELDALRTWALETVPDWSRLATGNPWLYEAHTIMALLAKWCLSGSPHALLARDDPAVAADRQRRLTTLHQAGKYSHAASLPAELQGAVWRATFSAVRQPQAALKRTAAQAGFQHQHPQQQQPRPRAAGGNRRHQSNNQPPAWCCHHGYVGHVGASCNHPHSENARRYKESEQWQIDARKEGYQGPPPLGAPAGEQ